MSDELIDFLDDFSISALKKINLHMSNELISHGLEPTYDNLEWFKGLYDMSIEREEENGSVSFTYAFIPKTGKEFTDAILKRDHLDE